MYAFSLSHTPLIASDFLLLASQSSASRLPPDISASRLRSSALQSSVSTFCIKPYGLNSRSWSQSSLRVYAHSSFNDFFSPTFLKFSKTLVSFELFVFQLSRFLKNFSEPLGLRGICLVCFFLPLVLFAVFSFYPKFSFTPNSGYTKETRRKDTYL